MIVVVWLCYVVEQIGTDIQDNKCGWLIVQALSRATDAQKEVLQTNYGRHDDECVARVKAVYKELNMEKVGCVALQRLPHPGGWNRQRAAHTRYPWCRTSTSWCHQPLVCADLPRLRGGIVRVVARSNLVAEVGSPGLCVRGPAGQDLQARAVGTRTVDRSRSSRRCRVGAVCRHWVNMDDVLTFLFATTAALQPLHTHFAVGVPKKKRKYTNKKEREY